MKLPLKSWFVRVVALGALLMAPLAVVRAQAEPSAASATSGQLAPASSEILRLVQAGVQREVLLGFIGNSTNFFNLTADDLILLHNHGVPNEVTTAMLQHDYTLRQASFTNQVNQVASSTPATTNANTSVYQSPAIAEPPQIVEGQPAVDQFHQALAPYGAWFQLPDWGWVWQPREAAQNRDWRPYLDGGRWAWTDHGWYWESDYPWGWAGFHYGRWLEMETVGWVWFPDTVWAPSWVTWRYHADNVGWAPLPPNALVGNTVTEQQVYSSYDYGVPQQAYTFVNVHYIFVRDVRPHCLPPPKVREFYRHCKVVNDYGPGRHHRGVVNRGVPIERISNSTGRRFTPVPVHPGIDRRQNDNSGRSPGFVAPTQHQQPISPSYAGGTPGRHDDRPGSKPPVTLPAAPRLPAAPGTPGSSPTVNPGAPTPMNPIVPPMTPKITPMNPLGPADRAPGLTPAPPFRTSPPVHAGPPSTPSHPGQGHGQNKDWKSDRRRSHDAAPTPPAALPAAPKLTPAPPFRSTPPVHAATPSSPSHPGQGHGQNKEWKSDRRSHEATPTPPAARPAIPAPGLRPMPSVTERPAHAAALKKETWAAVAPQEIQRHQEKRKK